MDTKYNTCFYQVDKPTIVVTTDYRGTPINVGSKVAYNYSGNVAFGTVVQIVKDEWYTPKPHTYYRGPLPQTNEKKWWYHRFLIEIKHESGHISKVKNYQSFLVID